LLFLEFEDCPDDSLGLLHSYRDGDTLYITLQDGQISVIPNDFSGKVHYTIIEENEITTGVYDTANEPPYDESIKIFVSTWTYTGDRCISGYVGVLCRKPEDFENTTRIYHQGFFNFLIEQ
jgi:hypothetical protein